MLRSKTECRCGRSIPSDWLICGYCQENANLDSLNGSAEHRHYRYEALASEGWPNREVKPPLDPELLGHLADEVSKRAQEQALMGLRQMNRQLHDYRIRFRNARGGE